MRQGRISKRRIGRPANTLAAALHLCLAAPSQAVAEDPLSVAAAELVRTVLALRGDRAYGEYLSGECVTCHQLSGHADGIPAIVGLSEEYLIRSLIEYKTGIRTNNVMQLMAGRMGDEEIAGLAAYFSALEPH